MFSFLNEAQGKLGNLLHCMRIKFVRIPHKYVVLEFQFIRVSVVVNNFIYVNPLC